MKLRPRAVLALFLLVLSALIGAGMILRRGIARVPSAAFGIAGDRVLAPGWHLVSPLARVEILPREGDGALPPVPVTTREGTRGEAGVSFRYRVDPERLARESSRRRLGFHPVLEEAAAEAFRETLSPRSALELLDHAGLDSVVTAALTRRLREEGIEVSDVRWEIRLPGELRRSLLKQEVRSLLRPTGIRILLIGLDAADWESIDPLLAAGRLPNLARLIERGVRGNLRSYNPMISPLLWTTAATGKGPDRHGVADFTVRQARTGSKIPISSRYRKVKAIWNILTDLDRSSVVVGWWASYPADRLKGYLVSDRVAALSMLPDRERLAGSPGYTFPPGYLGEILPRLSHPDQISPEEIRRFADVSPADYAAGLDWIAHPPAPPGPKEKLPPQDPVGLLIKILTAARNYQTVARDLLGRGPFDLTAVYFEGIDLVGHRFQHYRPPRMAMVTETEYRKFREVVTEYYVYQDRLLGELIERAGSGATVLVLSDHGFKTGARRPEGILPYTVDQPVEWHREEGIFLLSGPGAGRGRLGEPVTLFDIAPTLLALLGLPLPGDMPGRVVRPALASGFLDRFPPGAIPTYEGLGELRRTEEESAPDAVSAEMVAQLRALGYVGGDAHADRTPSEGATRASGPPPEAEETPVTFHRNLATYYLSRRDYPNAVAELLEANRREKLPKSYAMLAEAYDALGEKSKSMAALEEGWRDLPDGMGAESILWFVDLAAEAGEPERGRRFLDAHGEKLKESPAIREAAEGRIAESNGDRQEAERLYTLALTADPTLVAATRRLAGLYGAEDRMEAIRPILEDGLRRSERIDEYHNLLGALDSKAGRQEAALAHFRRALDLNPADPRFALNASLTLMDLGRWPEAGEVLEKAPALEQDPELLLALGNVRLQSRRPAEALAAFEKARSRGGDPSRIELGIALSTLRLRGREEALTVARESLSRHPDNPALQQLLRDLEQPR